ncbi:MAG: ribonuclease P protein component [bacterium]|nr:ribonuclease P protein component [bacterium]MDN5835587.1 ribonuclease P protein component [bacterium]
MIPYKQRFHGHGSLRYLYRNGDAVRSRTVTIKYITNPMRKNHRLAVVISKKVLKSAVRRNRVRRRIYEIMRLEMTKIDKPQDIALLVFSSEVLSMSHDELKTTIKHLLNQAGLYQN